MFFEKRLIGAKETIPITNGECSLKYIRVNTSGELRCAQNNLTPNQKVVAVPAQMDALRKKAGIESQNNNFDIQQSIEKMGKTIDTYWENLPLELWGFTNQSKAKVKQAMGTIMETTYERMKSFHAQGKRANIQFSPDSFLNPKKFLEDIEKNATSIQTNQGPPNFANNFNPYAIWNNAFPNQSAPSFSVFSQTLKEAIKAENFSKIRKKSNKEIRRKIQERVTKGEITQEQANKKIQEIERWDKKGQEVWEIIKISDQSSTDEYIKAQAESIKQNPPKWLFKNEQEGYKGEVFAGVIEFLKNPQKRKLTSREYQIIHQMTGSGGNASNIEKRYRKKVDNRTKKIKKEVSSAKTGAEKKQAPANVKKMQLELFSSQEGYQLAMIQIAKDAKTLINKEGTPEKYVEIDKKILVDEKVSDADFLRIITSQTANGHTVKNAKTDAVTPKGIAEELASRVNLENAFVYEVVWTWGLLTLVANLMVMIGSKNFDGAAYAALGGITMYAATKSTTDSWIPKMTQEEHMPKWIMMESSKNRNYREYFSNDWEVALAENMNWDKKAVRESIKTENKSDKKDTKKKIEDGKISAEQYAWHTIARDKLQNQIKPDDFRNSYTDDDGNNKQGALSSFLPNIVMAPDGNGGRKPMNKEKFLTHLAANRNTGSQGKGVSPNIRFKMFKEIGGRVNSRDSILPHLHTLHQYANAQKSPNPTSNRNKHVSGPSFGDTSQKVQIA